MQVLVISCSLNPDSRSAELAREAVAEFDARQARAELADLRDYDLPLCDGQDAYAHPQVGELARLIRDADAVLMAVPVYNYYANAAAKNLIELTGKAWNDKIVGFMCAAGGHGSFMSVMALANSLMLDFRCLIVPRFVYSTGEGFHAAGLAPAVAERVGRLADDTVRLVRALKAAPATQ